MLKGNALPALYSFRLSAFIGALPGKKTPVPRKWLGTGMFGRRFTDSADRRQSGRFPGCRAPGRCRSRGKPVKSAFPVCRPFWRRFCVVHFLRRRFGCGNNGACMGFAAFGLALDLRHGRGVAFGFHMCALRTFHSLFGHFLTSKAVCPKENSVFEKEISKQ